MISLGASVGESTFSGLSSFQPNGGCQLSPKTFSPQSGRRCRRARPPSSELSDSVHARRINKHSLGRRHRRRRRDRIRRRRRRRLNVLAFANMGSGDGNTDPSPASHRTTLTITSYPIALPTKFHFEIDPRDDRTDPQCCPMPIVCSRSIHTLVTPSAG